MDNFEKHIRENKHLFDDQKADKAKLWANIELKLDDQGPKTIKLWQTPLIKVAASILLLLGMFSIVTLLVGPGMTFENQDNVVHQELLDIDVHYKNLVSHQVQLVMDHPKLSEEDKEEFLSFIEELDEEYEVLKLEMKKNLDNELVLEAIIINYKKRIELIENLLRQINDSKITNDNYGYTL